MLPPIDFSRLDRFEKLTGICTETLIAHALDAALNYFEAHGTPTFPLTLASCGSCRFLVEHYQAKQNSNIIPFPGTGGNCTAV
jgi:hypothetical protein